MQYPDRIEGWLEKLKSKDPEADESEGHQISQDEIRVLEPTTPTKQTSARPIRDEVSPTDTTFSESSIFDRPLRKGLFSSPTPRYGTRDDDSDTTSIVSDDWELATKTGRICLMMTFSRCRINGNFPGWQLGIWLFMRFHWQ